MPSKQLFRGCLQAHALILMLMTVQVWRLYLKWTARLRCSQLQLKIPQTQLSNIERLSGVLIQTQIARGRIFDADAASEASRLAKQQILAGAASRMIALAAAQQRGLIDVLI